MTCRHKPGDPSCSSNQPRIIYRDRESTTPDKANFSIVDAKEIASPHAGEYKFLILKVKYPNCKECSYEGVKIMVFSGVSALDALKWDEIDPHFRDPTKKHTLNQAPSPIARFPASAGGWNTAIKFVNGLR